MAMRDEDFGAIPTLTEADDGLWSPPMAAPSSAPRDWQSLCEQAQARVETERARADAAEARIAELLAAERTARSRAGQLNTQLDKNRDKLKAAVEEVKEVRRTAKDALFYRSEVARLEKLLSEAGVDSRKRSTIVSLRMEVFQLREALQVVQAREDTTAPTPTVKVKAPEAVPAPKPGKEAVGALRQVIDSLTREVRELKRENARLSKALEEAQEQTDEIAALRRKVEALRRRLKRAAKSSPPRRASAELRKARERARKQKDTIGALRGEVASLSREIRRLNRENHRLRRGQEQLPDFKKKVRSLTADVETLRQCLAVFGDQSAVVETQKSHIMGLRTALNKWGAKNRQLEAELAERPLLSAVFKVVRARNGTIESLHKEIARQRKANAAQGKKIRALRALTANLEGRIVQLRSSRAVLSKAVFGSRSEKQETPRSDRKRGQQRGAPGHGRTQRPALKEKEERREPPPDALICSCCGKPYIANGENASSVIEIAVKAHIRRIVRPRYRRGCECASSALEAIAPPPARLFPRTPYGISVWARILYERFACHRPLRRVAAWMADQGLPIAPGTMASSVRRFLPLFAPLAEAILAHQNGMAVRHGDETGWRIQALGETGGSRRAWLWISVGKDAVYYRIDPSRSAEAAMKLFGSVEGTVFLVCDRYVAYVKMARELDGKVILCWCWIHQRRDFIECAAGQVKLRQWCEGWIERFASVFRLNKERLKHYDPALALERQSPAFDAAHAPLKNAVEDLFTQGEAELAGLPDKARQGKALRSLLKHREGLSVFVDNPQVPMDNNLPEREFRKAVIGRRLCFGSDSEDGADLTSTMYSVFGTLSMNGIVVLRWLEAWLEACAENGGQPPDDLSPWLPWTMTEERRREFMTPE
ncbi:MAG: IS66 family transposase [Alphaproteobacteria bacterium]|nr:IS66 family transposase [Alphaproteobacteria bacterium]